MSAVGWRGSSVAVVSAAMLAVTAGLGLARFGYALLIPDMRTALGVGYAEMGALASANFVGYVAAALVGGMLGTRFGVRRVLFAGLVIVTAATAGTGLATSIPVAAAYQVFAGIGGAVCAVSGIGLAASYVEPRWRGLATGVATGGNGLGLGLSGLVLPAVLATGPDGWRWGWALLGSLCALCGAYVAFVVRQEARSPHGGVASGGQRHRVFGSPLVWWLCAVYLLWGLGYQIFGTFFASLAIADGGWDQWTAGRLWALTGFASIGSCPLWGFVSDRLGRPPVLALLLTVQGVACGLLVVSSAPASFVGAVILIAITGPAVVTIVMAGATDVAGAALAPTAVGLLNLCLGFGLFAGPLAAGWLRDLTGSFATSFALAMGALLVADLLALAGWPAFVRARHRLAP